MLIHREPHPLRGQKVTLRSGEEFRIEDWADRVLGVSWMAANGNPSALKYAVLVVVKHLPIDNEVLYGKIGFLGQLIHVSEISWGTDSDGNMKDGQKWRN